MDWQRWETLAICAISGFARSASLRITIRKRLMRSTIVEHWSRGISDGTAPDRHSQCSNSREWASASGRNKILNSFVNLDDCRFRRRWSRRPLGKYRKAVRQAVVGADVAVDRHAVLPEPPVFDLARSLSVRCKNWRLIHGLDTRYA